eukprot:12838900-Alexandrium_andersonii.AAC.1
MSPRSEIAERQKAWCCRGSEDGVCCAWFPRHARHDAQYGADRGPTPTVDGARNVRGCNECPAHCESSTAHVLWRCGLLKAVSCMFLRFPARPPACPEALVGEGGVILRSELFHRCCCCCCCCCCC